MVKQKSTPMFGSGYLTFSLFVAILFLQFGFFSTELAYAIDCKASFSPDNLPSSGGVAKLSWESSDTDVLFGFCSGPIPIPSYNYGLSYDDYPFEFESSKNGIETCTFTPFKDGKAGPTCSASVAVGSGENYCDIDFSKEWVDYSEEVNLSLTVNYVSTIKEAKLICSYFDPTEGSIVEGVNNEDGNVITDLMPYIKNSTINNTAKMSFDYMYGEERNKGGDTCEVYINSSDVNSNLTLISCLQNNSTENCNPALHCQDSLKIGPQCGSYQNVYDIPGEEGCPPVKGYSNWRDPISCGELEKLPLDELCEHSTKVSFGKDCSPIFSFHTCKPSYQLAWMCEDDRGHAVGQCSAAYWDGSGGGGTPTPSTTPTLPTGSDCASKTCVGNSCNSGSTTAENPWIPGTKTEGCATVNATANPSSLTAPGTSYVKWSTVGGSKMEAACLSGPVIIQRGGWFLSDAECKESGLVTECTQDGYAFSFDSNQTGTEICTFYPTNSSDGLPGTPFPLTIQALGDPTCGNGIQEIGEECDYTPSTGSTSYVPCPDDKTCENCQCVTSTDATRSYICQPDDANCAKSTCKDVKCFDGCNYQKGLKDCQGRE
jgi:hypothetical protein